MITRERLRRGKWTIEHERLPREHFLCYREPRDGTWTLSTYIDDQRIGHYVGTFGSLQACENRVRARAHHVEAHTLTVDVRR